MYIKNAPPPKKKKKKNKNKNKKDPRDHYPQYAVMQLFAQVNKHISYPL